MPTSTPASLGTMLDQLMRHGVDQALIARLVGVDDYAELQSITTLQLAILASAATLCRQVGLRDARLPKALLLSKLGRDGMPVIDLLATRRSSRSLAAACTRVRRRVDTLSDAATIVFMTDATHFRFIPKPNTPR